MKTKITLVTGGCGFVGRHLVKRLLKREDTIWIIDDLSTGKEPSLWLSKEEMRQINFIHDDLLYCLEKEMKSPTFPEFDEVYHLASIVGGRALIDGDPLLVAKDLAIDSVFFTWLTRKASRVNSVLYASSSAAYPIYQQTNVNITKLTENMIKFDKTLYVPDMTYGWSKLTGEYLASLAHKVYGKHVVCVRPFSGYGEDQDLTYPIPSLALRVKNHDNPIEVWGDGEQSRDFVYIEDCITAMMLAINATSGESYNISSGVLTSFNEIIKYLCELEGHKGKIKHLLDKPVGVKNRYGDSSKLYKDTGWVPEYFLKEGLQIVLNHIKK